jgi:serine/threonine protein kinase
MDLVPGQILGQYRIIQKIGEGGMGAVYSAEQPSIPRTVVIKVLSAAFSEFADARDRFRRELDMITRLEHPHILPVYDFGDVDGNPYLVMRFMTGGTLHDRLTRSTFGRGEAIRVLEQIARALDFAHDQGIVHRDLKPGNVLLDESGNAYLADFGLAKSVGGTRDLTATGSVLGSPAYMSPEQARGDKLDRRSDVYSFAVMTYQALSGHLPFDADDAWGFIATHQRSTRPHSPARADLSTAVEELGRAGGSGGSAGGRRTDLRRAPGDVRPAGERRATTQAAEGGCLKLPRPNALRPTSSAQPRRRTRRHGGCRSSGVRPVRFAVGRGSGGRNTVPGT